ncbi:integrin alpha-M-like isoform X3 [Gadus morhua]|uniref:integrin alpha-M-like isoform X3 n=1 Tax=Gadus morhua TaxID=8049 RepID=UPI0011B691E5|nr:integrin alpha-M-like isoform X3 [Gadus morhua]
MEWMITLVVCFSGLQSSQAFNVESPAWQTLTTNSGDPSGWFGYKVVQTGSGLLVSEPLLQTSPTERGRIYKCTTNNCQPIPLSVPVFAVNMSLGLTLTKDPASENTLACGPTLTRECRTINTYNGLCLKINSQNRAELQRPSILKDCPGLSDIAFLIDGSGSVAVRDFNATKVFVTRLVSSLRNGDTRFAITEYSGTPITYYHFDNFDLSKSLESKIPSISQQGEGTYTARAIEHVVTQVFSPTRGSRRSSKKVLIVITDGASLDFSNLDRAVNGAKAKGIVRFTIGVGRAFDQSGAKAELKKIASRPPKTHVFRVSNFDALDKIRDTLEESIFPIEGTQTGGSLIMEMAQEGFSAAFVPGGGFQMASVGAYDWSGGFRGYSSDGQLTFPQDEQFVEKDSYLGYSMAVAHTRSGPLTIVGAPRYLHRGVVFVYPKSLDISKGQMVDPSPWQVCQQEISVKTKSQIGEYFGAEIVTMAVNSTRQMFSKVVLIAAPLHMEEDWEGRVYVCQLTASRVDCQFEEPVVLRGQAGEKGRFGSSMAPLPDLNQDGVYDLAVGAPLENQGQGSVYIFHGDMRGTINPRISQRIAGSDIQPGLQFFGLSISQSSSDLSGDGLPDLAVGSKGKVFLLRSKPIVMVEAQVTFTPAQIPPSPSDCLTPVNISAEVCFTMSGPPSVLQTVQAKINFTLSPDATRKRAYFTPNVRVRGESFTLNQRGRCFTYRVVIEPCPDDSLNDLYNELTFSFVGVPSTDDLSPSLSQQALTTSYHPLSFKINCENACADELKVGFNFSGSSAVRVGMDDLLNVTTSLTNLGGDSYNSQVVLTYPAGLSFRKFSTLQGRVECSSVDSENGLSLGLSSCWVYRPILKTNAKAVFTVSYGIDSNSRLSHKICITAKANSGNLDHSQHSVLKQTEEIDVKYSIFLSIAGSLSYTNFTFGRKDLHKPVVNPVTVLNFGRAFNVTVLIKVPVRLGGEHIWQEREDLQDCSVASCLVFRCNMFMGRAQSNTFTINGNLSSGWITQIGIQSAKFLLISTATLEYDEDTYIFFSTESKHTPPIRKIVTEVEVYPVANFTKEIIGRTVGGLPLLAIIAVALYKAGFFKSHYKQMIKEAGTSGEGGEGGDGGGDGGGEGGGDGGEAP